jgi:hypothetical protein
LNINKKEFIFTGQDLADNIFWSSFLVTISIFGIYIILDTYYILLKFIPEPFFLLLMSYIAIPLSIYWAIWNLLKRKLILSEEGVEFYIGNKLKAKVNWKYIKSFFHGRFGIYVHYNNNKKYFVINHISQKQIKEIKEILKSYAKKYRFELDI